MADATLAREVAAMRSEFVSVVTGRLMAAGPEAIEALRACLAEERAADRRQAAVDMLRLGLAYRRQSDLESEVAALKAPARGAGRGGDPMSRSRQQIAALRRTAEGLTPAVVVPEMPARAQAAMWAGWGCRERDHL